MRSGRTRRARLAFALLFTIASFLASTLQAQIGAIGLSGVGGRRFPAASFGSESGAQFGQVLVTGDFNGDGAADLATGIPNDDRSGIADSGAVHVRHGIPGVGFDVNVTTGVVVLHQGLAGSPETLGTADRFGLALAACDFNGDGFDDLAVGAPGDDPPGQVATSGLVQIFHGGSGPVINSVPDILLSPATPGIPGDVLADTSFGGALACGDFDDDGFADLAIGAPTQWIPSAAGGSQVQAGAVVALYGSAGGLDPSSAIEIHQNLVAVLGEGATNDRFGGALVAGDFFGDGGDDLVVGVREDGTGAVQLFHGQPGPGLVVTQNNYYTEGTLSGIPEPNDWFGYSLASGDFNGDQIDDLVIGVPFEDVFSVVDGGQVVLFHASLNEVRFLTENLVHGDGSTESGDRFGIGLAGGDFDRDGYDDLAVGGPGEFVFVPQDGMVTVVMGSEFGLALPRRRGIYAGLEGMPGVANQADRNHGHALAAGDFDGDGHADLAIGAPLEDAGAFVDIGAEVVLFGSLFSDGFDSGSSTFWSATAP